MSRTKSRRDFLLDSGALTHFSQSNARISLWFEEIHRLYDEPGFFVPYENYVEAITGDPRRDANVHRLLNGLAPNGVGGSLVIYASPVVGERAAWLRTQAITTKVATPKRPISVGDATLVALAEERSARNGVTIITSDANDIQLLVDLAGTRNVGVYVV